MALIEIDVDPMVHSGPARWNVKINAEQRTGGAYPDIDRKDFTTVNEAIEFVQRWMNETMYL